jgi:RNA-binding protein
LKRQPVERAFMNEQERRRAAHDLDATLRVGKAGVDAVAAELRAQLEDRQMVKVKFLRSARGGPDTEELAEQLADLASATVFQTRGHTAVLVR